jgi:putative SOS response-associated peptidase YedK
VQGEDGTPTARECRWGFVPRWAKDTKLAPINAKAETVATSRMFKPPLSQRRCLVPVSGFYEWEQLPDKSKRP